MARPRIFVSSTYYDLKYIRASLDVFVKSLGFDPILSEKGDIAFTADRPLDESCYREVESADIFVLIVGGRYGSEISGESKKPKEFFDRYESITKKEYSTAVEKDVPVYILVERGVYAEYQTFIRNKDIKSINYAHVDSVNVFLLIEDILAKPRNNPVQTFEKFEDIEYWLREQWAGLFRELLRRQSQNRQLTGLSEQVSQLKETNETLKKYLEAVMLGAGKQATSRLIKSEEKRLSEVGRLAAFRRTPWVGYLAGSPFQADLETVAKTIREAAGFEDFAKRIQKAVGGAHTLDRILSALRRAPEARRDFNEARRILGLPPFRTPETWSNFEGFNPDEVPRLNFETRAHVITRAEGSPTIVRAKPRRKPAAKRAAKKPKPVLGP